MKNLLVIVLFSLLICLNLHSQDVEKRVQRYIKWMSSKEKPNVWGGAARLQTLGTSIIPIIKRQLKDLTEKAQVGCCKVLIELGEIDYGLNHLLELLKTGKDRQAKLWAIEIISIAGDFELEEDLEKIMNDSRSNPFMKIAVAKALWQIARNQKATKLLKEFLRSDMAQIQFEAALALGEINNVRAAAPILNKLKDEPTERGKLARILLEKEAMVRLLDSQGGTRTTVKAVPKYPLVDEVVKKVKEYHINGDQFGKVELINAAIRGVITETDLHSAFWTEKEWNDFEQATINEEYVGIGVYVGERNGHFTVISPIYSGPAYRAGLRSMDRIVDVNGWSTSGKPIGDIIKRIKGDRGTQVKLKVYRSGWTKIREFTIKREKIRVPSLFFETLPTNIGYMRLTQFGRKATDDMEKALQNMEQQGMKALILDLRENAGGWLRTAVDVVDKFLSEGKLIVYSKGRHPEKGKKNEYFSTNEKPHPDIPMVILVDQSSASASEIVAGALQHYKRATIVGLQTYGKGSVQEVIVLDSRPGAKLKLTIAKYFLPDGRCIHNKMDKYGKILQHNGIVPDIKVKYEKWEPWKNEAFGKIQENQYLEKYVKKHYEKNKKLFYKLAENDGLSHKQYPEFEAWYKSLNTKASKQDVRFWLRSKVRRKVADVKGREYACDYLEDVMLQNAIGELCRKRNLNIKDISEFKVFADKLKK